MNNGLATQSDRALPLPVTQSCWPQVNYAPPGIRFGDPWSQHGHEALPRLRSRAKLASASEGLCPYLQSPVEDQLLNLR